jgi:hypothetical protein
MISQQKKLKQKVITAKNELHIFLLASLGRKKFKNHLINMTHGRLCLD